jgi:hypothetical protein
VRSWSLTWVGLGKPGTVPTARLNDISPILATPVSSLTSCGSVVIGYLPEPDDTTVTAPAPVCHNRSYLLSLVSMMEKKLEDWSHDG